MKPRITIDINHNGELEILVNPAGRDLLVRELQSLTEARDHFHLGPEGLGGEVPFKVPHIAMPTRFWSGGR